jgi:hypothetical protein
VCRNIQRDFCGCSVAGRTRAEGPSTPDTRRMTNKVGHNFREGFKAQLLPVNRFVNRPMDGLSVRRTGMGCSSPFLNVTSCL